jgi:citrate synthase
MRTVTEQELNNASAFAAYVTVCTGAIFLVGILAAFLS